MVAATGSIHHDRRCPVTKTIRNSIVAAGAATILSAGPAIAAAAGTDDTEPALTGDALGRASQTALEHTGGGRVTGTEVGDEESYYEVEVTLDDGRQVDVQLDESFSVVSSTPDVVGNEDANAQ
jgi:uncharacterized membrane protein YkoI